MKIFLSVSVLLNVLLLVGLLFYRPIAPVVHPSQVNPVIAPPVKPAPAPTPEAEAPEPASAPVKTEQIESLVGAWDDTPENLIARMRAAGLPRKVILSAMIALDMKRLTPKRLSIVYPNGLTRWSGPRQGDFREIEAMYATARAEMAQKMGPDFYEAFNDHTPSKSEKWGNLASEDLAKVTKLSDKYDQILSEGPPLHGGLNHEALAWSHTINESYEKDIRAALGPEKAEDFLTYNSFEALNLQSTLAGANIAVDEGTYLDLLQARGELRDAFREEIASGKNDYSARKLKETEMYESILGPEKGLQIALSSDPALYQIDSLLAASGHDLETRVNLYKKYLNTLSTQHSIQTTYADNLAAAQPQLASIKARYYNELASRIPAPELQKVMQTPPGAFLRRWSGGNP